MTGPAHGLRVNHLDEPLGILETPRFSWRLPAGAGRQLAYRLRCGNGWDSSRTPGASSLLIPYAGPALAAGRRVDWRVKVWTDLGEHDWSAPSWFETGLLSPDDWAATWIAPPEVADRPAHLLRGSFTAAGDVVRARLYATAHGIYEAFLNGVRVGDAELTPGYTQYHSRLQVQTYDVTDLIRPGDNRLDLLLSDGWFRGQTGALRSTDQWGSRTAALAQLTISLADGSTVVSGTGPDWLCRTSHLLAADLIAGQHTDFRARGNPTADRRAVGGWKPVEPVPDSLATLVGSPAPPVRRVEEIRPVAITSPGPGRQVVDLGQNINGWVRLARLGPAGVPITLTHGEHLDATGDVTTDHLRPAFPFLPAPLPAGMVDEVVPAGVPGEIFEPRHTTHGFRYVQITGLPFDLDLDDVRGVVVHTDMRRTGWFSCSSDPLNALHEAAVWSLRDNACDIPTDCPQRERAGWTGDWQIFVRTAAFLYDVAGFSTKWLRDVVADQWDDGTIANMSPCPPAEGRDSTMAVLNGSAGWGDAIIVVPWRLFRAYGDKQLLDEMWPAMRAWLARAENMARTRRHPSRVGPPAAHEAYLWDSGFHWGEWLAPGDEPDDFPAFVAADKSDVATAYLSCSAGLMARIADVLGRPSEHYRSLAAGAREAWQSEFLGADGTLRPDTQANHVRALAFDLVPASVRPAVAARLVALVRAAGTRLTTGFLATPDLLPVLADADHLDVAYDLLLRTGTPSWLGMIERGATTMWERWDGIDADGVAHESLNHYAKGAVVSFLHRYVAGLEIGGAPDTATGGPADIETGECAYRRFRVRPRPGGGLTWAQAAHESPYGRIEVRWTLQEGRFDLSVSVPPGTVAEAILPDGATHTLAPGEHHLTC